MEEFTADDFVIGDRADDVRKDLIQRGIKKIRCEEVGEDDFGLIVTWMFSNVMLILGREKYISPYMLRFVVITEEVIYC
jgi:hypothetical protein